MVAAATPKVLAPIEALRGVVVCCWALDGLDLEPKQDVPDGCVDLLFAFGERVEAMAIGVATRARSASRPARCVVGVTLAPGEALPIVDVPLHELRDMTVSLRELWPRTERTGLGPKEMARVARLRSVLAHLASERRADWADLANAFGYADQAHLIHEFQALTGKTPARYLAEGDAVTRQVDATGFYPVPLIR